MAFLVFVLAVLVCLLGIWSRADVSCLVECFLSFLLFGYLFWMASWGVACCEYPHIRLIDATSPRFLLYSAEQCGISNLALKDIFNVPKHSQFDIVHHKYPSIHFHA